MHPTHSPSTTLLTGAASLWLAALAIAQSPIPDPTILQETISPIVDHGQHQDGSDAGIWAGGKNYKVSLRGGMTFYPHVGPTLPHQPFAWRTTSVKAGARELLTGDAKAARCTDTVCDYDFGEVIERYEVRQDGLEQQFVFDRFPGEGELVIRGHVTTPLLPRQGSDGLTFALADGRVVIHYGEAIAIDSLGVKHAVRTELSGNDVTLRLDAAFAASASYPLVIDPLVNNILLESGAPVTDCDVLHENLSAANLMGRTWVVYSREIATNDHDLWLKRLDTNFAGTPVEVFREISMWNSMHGRIALCGGANRTVTVFSTGPQLVPTAIQSFVETHAHDVGDMNLRTSVGSAFSVPGAWDWRPEIGGRTDNGVNMLILFQREVDTYWSNTTTSAVYAGILDASVGTQGAATGPAFLLSNHPNQDQERPAVTPSAESGAWLVAYQEYNNQVANDDWDIQILRVTGVGGISSTALDVQEAGNPLLHKLSPHLAGSFGRYELCYVTQVFQLHTPKPQNALGERVRGQRIDWNTSGGSLPYNSVVLDTSSNADLDASSIAFDFINNSIWCATVRDTANQELRVHKLGYRGQIVETGSIAAVAGVTADAIAVGFNQDQRDFPLVFARNNASANGNRLSGTRMVYDTVAAPLTYGFSCGSGVWGSTTVLANRQQIGTQGMPLNLVNAPVDGVAFLLLSLGQSNFPMAGYGMGGCRLLVDPTSGTYLGTLVVGVLGGAASQPLDLIESLTPLTVYAQWAYPAPGANPAGLQASEGMAVEIGR